MKLGVFTDSHYSSQEVTCGKRYNSRSLEKIKQALAHFQEENCDLILCLGDLTDKETNHQREIQNVRELSEVLKNAGIPVVCVMGNHDAFSFEKAEFYEILGLPEPADISQNGKHLIFLDACYFKSGKRYGPGDSDWTDTFLPDIDTLKAKLETLEGEIYLFIHQSIDPAIRQDHRLYNAERIIELVNKSGKVKTIFQGHYHPGKYSVHNGIPYETFPAMCENENAWFIREI